MKMNFKIIIKAAVIGALLLLMLIPLAFVKGTVSERLDYKKQAEEKITKSWGQEVLAAAPVLNVPYKKLVKEDKKDVYKSAWYKYTPAVLDANIEILPQVRYIGIFKVPVFTAKVKMKGHFASPARADMASPSAFVSLEFGTLKGIASTPVLTWNGKKTDFENALEGEVLSAGQYEDALRMLAAPAPSKNERMDFEISFDIRGSNSLSFAPLAKDNKFTVSSSWPSPNFLGGFLPDERKVDAGGFTAVWNVNSLSSGIPAYVNGYNGALPLITVSLMFPVDNYRNCERAVKYGILFIALTFLACFVFEVAGKMPVHPFQYILVGLAMAVFYLLLIALSEFIGFAWAYITAAAATVGLISAYARYGVIKRSGRKVWYAAAGLGALYIYLYVLLQLEDLSLIFGTLGLFAGIAAVMYATRNINWYEER
ncbi:MAG: cell envelope integrity protein CreD [Elusimicrobiota bacterium]|jgi:inner membrane protein|nr:cell envelope integrity protein CreD [Elusimicrobiota bacterium]